MNITSDHKKNYWIVGASSGIGRSLAIELASQGHRVIVSGRRLENLQKLKDDHIPNAGIYQLDINNAENVRSVYNHIIKDYGHIDSFLFFAAQYEPMTIDSLDLAKCHDVIHTNYVSLFSLMVPIIHDMKQRHEGQIVLCASVAGYIGLPNAQPYASTKAAIINLAETMRTELDGLGIDVKIVSPGFVKTEMTAKNSFEMPMLITSDTAAQRILKQLDQRSKFEIKTHGVFTWIMKFLSILPYVLYFQVFRKKH